MWYYCYYDNFIKNNVVLRGLRIFVLYWLCCCVWFIHIWIWRIMHVGFRPLMDKLASYVIRYCYSSRSVCYCKVCKFIIDGMVVNRSRTNDFLQPYVFLFVLNYCTQRKKYASDHNDLLFACIFHLYSLLFYCFLLWLHFLLNFMANALIFPTRYLLLDITLMTKGIIFCWINVSVCSATAPNLIFYKQRVINFVF